MGVVSVNQRQRSRHLMVVAVVGRGTLLPRRKPVKLFLNYSKVKRRALKKENREGKPATKKRN